MKKNVLRVAVPVLVLAALLAAARAVQRAHQLRPRDIPVLMYHNVLDGDGLNVWQVSADEFGKLRDSMRRLHRFLRERPLLVEADGMVKCGNKRFRALVENGVRFVPAEYVRRLSEYSEEEVREFVLQDLSFF